MHIYLNKETDNIEVVPTKKGDPGFFKKFPGFVLANGAYTAPAKPAVVYNLIQRLKKYPAGRKATMTPEVAKLNTRKVSLREIPQSFKYFTSPLRHQVVALRFLWTNRGGGLLLDPGLGKTKIVLDFIALCNFKRSLIVCPKALLFVWEEEQAFHRPDKSIYVVKSLTWDNLINYRESLLTDPEYLEKEREKIRKEIKDIDAARTGKWEDKIRAREAKLSNVHLMNAGLKTEIDRLKRKRDEDWRAMWEADIVVVNYNKAVDGLDKLLELNPDFMAVDEALVKDHKSTRTKSLMKLAHQPGTEVCLMSGTLINNSPEDTFAPVQMMEPSLIGKSMTKFRERYCKLAGKLGQRFTVGYQNLDELKASLRTCSIIMRKEEWLDLPEKVFKPITVPVEQDVKDMYMELASNYICTVQGQTVEVDSPLTAHCKLSQIGSGFLYKYDDDEDMELLFNQETKKKRRVQDRETIFLPKQPKADMLMQLLGEELKDRKMILWYNLSAELEIIEKRLMEAGINYRVIKGGEKNTGAKVTEFNNTPEIQILVCQAKSVNYGITVLGRTPESLEKDGVEVLPNVDPRVYTHVFYSLSYSLEMFIQQQDRSHRIGVTRSPEYYLLLADLPIEQMVSAALQQKRELREDFLEDSLAEVRNG